MDLGCIVSQLVGSKCDHLTDIMCLSWVEKMPILCNNAICCLPHSQYSYSCGHVLQDVASLTI